MRILLVNDYATPVGGAEVLIQGLRRGLEARGHHVRFLASRAGAPEGEDAPDVSAFGTLGTLRTPLQAANLSARAAMTAAVRDFRPDVVHVGLFLTQLSPLILGPLSDVPAVCHVQWYRAMCPVGTKRLPDGSECAVSWGLPCLRNRCLSARAWAPLMLQRGLWYHHRAVFDLFVIPSESMRARLEEAGLGPVTVVPNGVFGVPAAAEPSCADTAGDDPTGAGTIAFAGRFVPEKGVRTLVEAFAIVAADRPEARLLLVGDGPERPAIEARATALGLAGRVAITGWVDHPTVERHLASAAVQAVPSEWAEPFGIVAAEALARGTPVVATNVGGLAEIIDDDVTGLLVEPGDATALARALLRLLGDAGLRGRLARAGRVAAAERFGAERFIDAMLEVYERARAA